MIVDVIRIEDGLVKYRDTFPDGPPAFFADITQRTSVSKNAIYTLQTLLGDGVVVGLMFCRLKALAYGNIFFPVKDLSLLRRLAIYLGYHPAKHAVE